jgi:2'-5' RNA ligase
MNAEQRTGLVLLTPGLEDLVDPWRRRYDPVRAYGMPAHVTILYPWLPYESITDGDREALATLCHARPPLEMTFADFGRFPETLWLDPQPARPIVDLVQEIAQRWPAYPPFAGAFADIVAHLTLADRRDPDSLRDVIDAVQPRLPVCVTVPALTLMRLTADRWVSDTEFPFAG